MGLNAEQSKGLANFYFDVAKGIFLGGVSLAVFNQPQTRPFTFVLSAIISYTCVQFALNLLKDVK